MQIEHDGWAIEARPRQPEATVRPVTKRGKLVRLQAATRRDRALALLAERRDVRKLMLVPDKIAREINKHCKGARLTMVGVPKKNEYGVWHMKEDEVEAVAEFLADRHSGAVNSSHVHPPPTPTGSLQNTSPANPGLQDRSSSQASCKHCGSNELTARWGKFGYYWRCGPCRKNTKMPVQCSACNAERRKRNEIVKIRKSGPEYFRECGACGVSELIWSAPL